MSNRRQQSGEPPYSSGQDSANDNNQNERYPNLDASIRDTYAARSTATNKNSLYDSYIRAIRWATLRIKDRGVIAFVTNGGFLDSNTADGLRKTLADEFSQIYVYNLRGNQRTAGEQSRREGGKVFDAGSRATVAITVLVKNPSATGPTTLHYNDIGDYLTRQDKLRIIRETGNLEHLDLATITPNSAADWLNQRNNEFAAFMQLGSKDDSAAIFGLYSGGLKSNRDAWVYNFARARLTENMRRLVDTYGSERIAVQAHPSHEVTEDATQISWNRGLPRKRSR